MKRPYWTIAFTGCCMIILILDTKTALAGASDGLSLCLSTLIPSLFPFILLSKIMVASLLGRRIPLSDPLCRLLRIPEGAASIFLVGLLGGYPIGAQCIIKAVNVHAISRKNGERMLTFCSNAGPAFIFGIGTRLFSDSRMCWIAWGIHILAAVITAVLVPGGENERSEMSNGMTASVTTELNASVRTMAVICGWVVIFRVILAFCKRWFLWALPTWCQYLFAGLLELSNGCCELAQLPDETLRFILFSGFLSFGGICVAMQTKSVCDGLNIRPYMIGKLTQTVISTLCAVCAVSDRFRIHGIISLICFCIMYFLISKKSYKAIAFSGINVYNRENTYAR